MKLATMRRRPDGLAGVSGVARLDRRTTRLAGRLNPGDIAIIDHVDLDRVAAEALVAARPAVVINAQPSISGRYPNLGPEVIVAAGILLIDNVGSEVFAAIKEGTRVRIDGDTVFVGEHPLANGTAQTAESVREQMRDARSGLATQLEAFAATTSEYMSREHSLLLDGVGVPQVRTNFQGKHVLVVVRGYDHVQDLKSLKHYIREFKPVLVGVDGGADALLSAGHKPHMVVGDMDAVSDAALGSGAEVVVHAYPDGRAPGMTRAQDFGIDPVVFATSGTSEDIAMLLADEKGAELIVAVGTHATLTEFLDKGRAGMASSFLTRLRIGAKLVDARG
ncbi:putative cytokinetic ring protein SteA, partial [Jatrophihabitans sp.]|uniref:putative cytokinetic ring protein SteA n=1 Tax=Jatrophihabitans sp. TaxID=1932789 RepID=UPI0030C69DC3|nr:thiamine pyrophosphokinae catalytic protein [Jatrophihabitans sp.]